MLGGKHPQCPSAAPAYFSSAPIDRDGALPRACSQTTGQPLAPIYPLPETLAGRLVDQPVWTPVDQLALLPWPLHQG
jgi:hypothetical protein